MPITNKARYVYQLSRQTRSKPSRMRYLDDVKLDIPFVRYRNAKVILIHDIDTKNSQKELDTMLRLEGAKGITSILMLIPSETLDHYKEFYDYPIGLHETFPYRFKKGMEKFAKYKLKIKCYSQHIGIKATNFYPETLNKLPVKYAFIDPKSLGFDFSYPLFFKPIKYQNKILISICGEPDKKAIDTVLEAASKQKGMIVFNFHPHFLLKSGKPFKRNFESFKYLLGKLG